MCVVVVVVVVALGFFYLLILLLQNKLHIRNAKSSNTSGQLDICSKKYPAQISDERSSFS